MALPTLFDERRTAQAAAFLLHRAGGTLPILKLIKLLYLAERHSFQRYGEPLTGDALVAMNNGPVLSATYDHIKGNLPSAQQGWDTWVSSRNGNQVSLRDSDMIRSPEQDLLRLSDSDLEILEETWTQFGHMSPWALVAYTHSDACPEWEHPHGTSRPITYETLFPALGYSPEQVSVLMERIAEHRALNAVMN